MDIHNWQILVPKVSTWSNIITHTYRNFRNSEIWGNDGKYKLVIAHNPWITKSIYMSTGDYLVIPLKEFINFKLPEELFLRLHIEDELKSIQEKFQIKWEIKGRNVTSLHGLHCDIYLTSNFPENNDWWKALHIIGQAPHITNILPERSATTEFLKTHLEKDYMSLMNSTFAEVANNLFKIVVLSLRIDITPDEKWNQRKGIPLGILLKQMELIEEDLAKWAKELPDRLLLEIIKVHRAMNIAHAHYLNLERIAAQKIKSIGENQNETI